MFRTSKERTCVRKVVVFRQCGDQDYVVTTPGWGKHPISPADHVFGSLFGKQILEQKFDYSRNVCTTHFKSHQFSRIDLKIYLISFRQNNAYCRYFL